MMHKVMLVVLTFALIGCQKSSISNEVDAKLASVHATSTPVPIAISAPSVQSGANYRAVNDPFVSPFYQVKNTDSTNSHNNIDDGKAGKIEKANTQPSTHVQQAPSKVLLGKEVHPKLNRAHHPLERFALSQLRYQGVIAQGGQLVALIMDADGMVHRVQEGQYMGQHHGKVMQIDRHEIIVSEAVQQMDGRYYERIERLRFAP